MSSRPRSSASEKRAERLSVCSSMPEKLEVERSLACSAEAMSSATQPSSEVHSTAAASSGSGGPAGLKGVSSGG